MPALAFCLRARFSASKRPSIRMPTTGTDLMSKGEGAAGGSLRDFLIIPSRETPASWRTEELMAVLVCSAVWRRGRTRKCERGIGATGGGGFRKAGGGVPSRSIIRHASRSAASTGQHALSTSVSGSMSERPFLCPRPLAGLRQREQGL